MDGRDNHDAAWHDLKVMPTLGGIGIERLFPPPLARPSEMRFSGGDATME
jgi:hypothetical protein